MSNPRPMSNPSSPKIEAYVTTAEQERTREQIAYLEGQLQTAREDRVVLERQLAYVTNERDTLVQRVNKPLLGLASNEELIRELMSRFTMAQYDAATAGSTVTVHQSISRALVLAEMLGGLGATEREYRTVDNG